jgi:hypothetical protein
MGRCCRTITRAVRLSHLNFSEAIAQNSGLEYKLYEKPTSSIAIALRLMLHTANVTEPSLPLYPNVIGMSFIVRKLKIVPPFKHSLTDM